jgi:hypothetical protein
MLWAYLKISLSLAIPISTLVYARQQRIEHDMQAIKWDVQHPPSSQWAVAHPREALQSHLAEQAYLRRLIADMES